MKRNGYLAVIVILVAGVCIVDSNAHKSVRYRRDDDHDHDHEVLSSSSSSSGNVGELPHNDHAADSGLGSILFLSATFLIGAITRHVINKFVPTLPYTVALLAIGLLIGIIFKYYDTELNGYTGVISIDPHLLMYTFLPVLLFESAFLLDIHAIKKSIGQILVLAVPGYLLSSTITAVVVMFIFSYNWSWDASMMVGAILGATDPVAVVALLKNSPGGKDVHHISIVIEGESLLNDGAAIVLFNIFQTNAMTPCPDQVYSCPINGTDHAFNASDFCDHYLQCDESAEINELMCTKIGATQVCLEIALKALGGPLFGIVTGYIVVYWLGKVFNDYLTEITITVGSPYLVYYMGEMFLRSSGVLSVVLFGCVVNMNKMNISPEIEAFLNKFWEQMGYLVNTIIFLVVGMIITSSAIDHIELSDIVYLGALYLGVSAARSLMLLLFHFFLTKMGYGSTWQSASILMWGALRGAVSLALALQVNHNVGFCQAMRNKILFFVSGIVVLTLLINSTTFNKILSVMGFCHVSKAKKIAVDSAAEEITRAMTKELDKLKADDTLTDSRWDEIKKTCYIETIYNSKQDEEQNRKEIEKLHNKLTACGNCSNEVPVPLTKAELSEFYDESRNRVFKAFKISLWKQFDSGLLGKSGLRFLDDTCDQTLDVRDKFIELSDIDYQWKIGPCLKYIKKSLEAWQRGRKQEEYPIPNNIHQYKIYELVSSGVFEIFILFFIFFNVTVVIIELSISTKKCTEDATGVLRETALNKGFAYANYCFLTLFIVEMILKLIGQRKYYFYHKWNLIDFAIILISIADSISDLFMGCNSTKMNFNVFRIIRIVRLFRCVRLIKWVFLFSQKVIRDLVHKTVSAGYNIGIGVLVASDDVLAHLDQIVAYRECRETFRQKIQKTRTDVYDSLGEVRKHFPGISIAMSTKQSIRLILNKGRETAWKLLEDGLVEEFDCSLFTKQIEEKMKRLIANPTNWINPPDAFQIISQAPWLKNLKDYIIYNVTRYAKHMMYNEGEVFLKRGEIAGGVYIIVSGRAQVKQSLNQASEVPDKAHTDSLPDVHATHSLHLACHHKHNDSLGPGSIVGEQSILVNKPRGSYVVCNTDIQCYFISAEDMHGLMLKYPVVEENLWRICSVRMAESLLFKSKKYKTDTFEDLKQICERSVLATLVPESHNGFFEVDSVITDVVLIYGEVRCFPSNALVAGPKLVPEGTTKLSLLTPCKLLILLNGEQDVDIAHYNDIPIEVARSAYMNQGDDPIDDDQDVEAKTSGPSLLDAAVSMTLSQHGDGLEDAASMKLSKAVAKDRNPNARQEYEKRRRRSHLKESMETTNNEIAVTVNHGRENSDSRLTPIEMVPEKKID